MHLQRRLYRIEHKRVNIGAQQASGILELAFKHLPDQRQQKCLFVFECGKKEDADIPVAFMISGVVVDA